MIHQSRSHLPAHQTLAYSALGWTPGILLVVSILIGFASRIILAYFLRRCCFLPGFDNTTSNSDRHAPIQLQDH